MEKLIFILLMILIVPFSSCEGQVEVRDLKQLRGVWLTNVDSDLMFSDKAIEEGMKDLSDLGFNTVFPVVWNDGFTLYPSNVMSDYFGNEFKQDTAFSKQGRDPLAVIIREARKNDLRVIPWFEFGFSSSFKKNGGHILSAKPQWAAKDSTGKLLQKNGFDWMNAINPEVQNFITKLVLEVIDNYDVDGFQGDDRLPAMPSNGGYSNYTKALYLKESGMGVPDSPHDTQFMDWKANKLTAYARSLYNTVKAKDESLIVSLAPSLYPWSKEQYLQDWPTWIEAGAVDLLIPQAYRWEIDRYKTTINSMSEHYQQAKNHEQVVMLPGIIIKAGDRYNGFDYVKEAVEYNRSQGFMGEVYFFYEGLFSQNAFLGDSLHTHFYNN